MWLDSLAAMTTVPLGQPSIGILQRSHTRCREVYGLDATRPPEVRVAESEQVRLARDQLGETLVIAEQECESLWRQSTRRGIVVILTDAKGVALNVTGDPYVRETYGRSGLAPDVVWSERCMGTNGIGTALQEKCPLVVHQRDHFFDAFSRFSCSGAPIEDVHGNLLAVLDMTSFQEAQADGEPYQRFSQTCLSARYIEWRHFQLYFRDHLLVHFNPRKEFVGLCVEGLLAVDDQGDVVGANRAALQYLGMDDRRQLLGLALDEVFSLEQGMVESRRGDGQTFFVRSPLFSDRGFQLRLSAERPRRASPARHRRASVVISPQQSPARFDLNGLAGSDARMLDLVAKARQLVNLSTPLLITGETGSGKELFAQALHRESNRAARPIIAKNCAAIPESLIESELFGYVPGAFTGATSTGMKGCIEASDGGTLFLDEIGDMPLSMQSRLLRVLETKTVQRLGSSRSIPVDLNVISSTNRDIEKRVRKGKFREDLYYRLNGMTLRLPALRERQDKGMQIRRMVRILNQSGQPVVFEREAWDRLLAYPWPGNFRQLRNVLRLIMTLAQGKVIDMQYFPEELLRDSKPAVPASRLPSSAVEEDQGGERQRILSALEACYWNLSRTAKRLGISRSTLYRKMERHGIHKGD